MKKKRVVAFVLIVLLAIAFSAWKENQSSVQGEENARAGKFVEAKETESATKDGEIGEVERGSRKIKKKLNWKLQVVNPWNEVPDDYQCERTQLARGHSIDSRCYPELQQMMDDCKLAGGRPYICSSYRTQAIQEQLFQNQIAVYVNQGYSEEEAENKAARSVARPGTSEHQLGLAVDILDAQYSVMDQTQEDTKTQQWLMRNCWKYGFILRYPNRKSNITGIIYEPWHYRYVGKSAAKKIMKQGICLEEYVGQ